MGTTQLDFGHLAAQASAPRPAGPRACAVAREDVQTTIDAAATGYTPARERELARIRTCLNQYIRKLGVGTQFQACDFITWMHATGSPPDESVIDPRCTGGMFNGLVHRNVLRVVGHRVNSGNKHTGYGSTARPVYVIDTLPEASQ